MREGSLDAPTRHPLAWREEAFYDPAEIDKELRRVFDICHGCRRCFNLCDSFPRLFDLIDGSPTEELDSVDSASFRPVVDACTLCDMCFMTKCPYVPPHEFDLDFPHLMLRAKAAERRRGEVGLIRRELARTDRNGKLIAPFAGIANWATDEGNAGMRNMLQDVAGIHREAALPKYHAKPLTAQAKAAPPRVNSEAPAHGRKAVLYATCFANYNNPDIGLAALRVLAHNGVAAEVVYPACCGMPLWEQGAIDQVVGNAEKVAEELGRYIDEGYDIIAPVPSCALMLKFEWPLAAPDNPAIRRLAEATYDITEYVVELAKDYGLAEGLQPLGGDVTIHLACHARAQNMGAKGAEMLRLIPDTKISVIERCSGHGGIWGTLKENFEIALKVGKPAARQARKSGAGFVSSECPLASEHLRQGMERIEGEEPMPATVVHPILLFARAYGLAM
jgi:glycerol-3-phosphate dehydrogenase subunit C